MHEIIFTRNLFFKKLSSLNIIKISLQKTDKLCYSRYITVEKDKKFSPKKLQSTNIRKIFIAIRPYFLRDTEIS